MSMLLRQYHATAGPATESEPTESTEPVGEGEAPAKSASKQDWVDYAVSQGHQEGSLDELTKAEIQSLFE